MPIPYTFIRYSWVNSLFHLPIDPTHHPCLEALPEIFLKSMQSVSNMVDAFVGIANRPRPFQKLAKSDTTADFKLIIGEIFCNFSLILRESTLM